MIFLCLVKEQDLCTRKGVNSSCVSLNSQLVLLTVVLLTTAYFWSVSAVVSGLLCSKCVAPVLHFRSAFLLHKLIVVRNSLIQGGDYI